MEIRAILNKIEADLEGIEDPKVSSALHTLINLVEYLASENAALKIEIQRLKDEINRLKGEQGKPDIRAQKDGEPQNGDDKGNTNHSSEKIGKIAR